MLFKTVLIFATAFAVGFGMAIPDEPKPIRNNVEVPIQGPPSGGLEERSAATTEATSATSATMLPMTTFHVDMTGTASVVLPTVPAAAAANASDATMASSTMASSTMLTTLDSAATTMATTVASTTTEDAMVEPAGNRTTSVESPVKLTLTRDITKDKTVVKDEIVSTGESSSESEEASGEEEERSARQDALAEAAGGEGGKYPEMTLTRNIKKDGAVIKDELRNAGEGERKQRDLTLLENKNKDSNMAALETNQLRKGREDQKSGNNEGQQTPHFQATRGFTKEMAMIKDEVNMGRKGRQAGGTVAASANAADIDSRFFQGQNN